MEIRDNKEFTEYITTAEKHGYYNAYGWFLRYMQIIEDLESLKKEHDKMRPQVDRAVDEVKKVENESYK